MKEVIRIKEITKQQAKYIRDCSSNTVIMKTVNKFYVEETEIVSKLMQMFDNDHDIQNFRERSVKVNGKRI